MSAADYTSAPSPDAGGPGHTHHEGTAFRRGFTRRERWFAAVILILAMIMSAGALVSQQLQQTSFQDGQRAQGSSEQMKLCKILLPLASLKPPTGPVTGYPARAYDQQLAARLAGLAPAVGCSK